MTYKRKKRTSRFLWILGALAGLFVVRSISQTAVDNKRAEAEAEAQRNADDRQGKLVNGAIGLLGKIG